MKHSDRGRPVPRTHRGEAALRRADRRHRHADEHAQAARRDALGGQGPARAGRQGRGVRPEVRGDRERARCISTTRRCWACRAATSRSRTTSRRIRDVGRAGIPMLGYHFMPNSVWRTERLAPGRGGAGCTAVRHGGGRGDRPSRASCAQFMPTTPRPPVGDAGASARARPVITEEQMWDELRLFHQGGAAGRRGGGRQAGAASRRSAGADARRRRAPLLPSRRASSAPASSAEAARPGASTSVSAAARRCRAARPTCAR